MLLSIISNRINKWFIGFGKWTDLYNTNLQQRTHMADLLKIRASNGNGITWQFVDETMVGYAINLDKPPTVTIHDGDIWHVELVETKVNKGRQKTAVVRLIARLHVMQPWEKLTGLPTHWIDSMDLKCILAWLTSGTDIILIGPTGTGKTTLGFVLAKTLGWQEPCKVDVYTIKRTTDLFGTDAARDGSTFFVRSSLLDYIDRATIALKEGLDTHFIVILDEINRVHAKVNESMHGLFDDTRQVTIPTADGSKIVRLPPNLHTIGTMNVGSAYLGTHGLDAALKSRFAPITVRQMPIDYETKKLVTETGILESQALSIVQVARTLRESADGGQLSSAPDYRSCRNVARLVKCGVNLKMALIKGFLGWYEGELILNDQGEVTQPNSEVAKAFSALRMKGIAKASDLTLK